MAVSDPRVPNLSGAFANIQRGLQQRAAIERNRPAGGPLPEAIQAAGSAIGQRLQQKRKQENELERLREKARLAFQNETDFAKLEAALKQVAEERQAERMRKLITPQKVDAIFSSMGIDPGQINDETKRSISDLGFTTPEEFRSFILKVGEKSLELNKTIGDQEILDVTEDNEAVLFDPRSVDQPIRRVPLNSSVAKVLKSRIVEKRKGKERPLPVSERNELQSLDRASGRIQRVINSFDPSFVGPIDAVVSGKKFEGILARVLSTPEKRSQFAQFKQAISQFRDDIINDLAGANVSPNEFQRIIQGIPTGSENDEVFIEKLGNFANELNKLSKKRVNSLKKSGFSGIEEIAPDPIIAPQKKTIKSKQEIKNMIEKFNKNKPPEEKIEISEERLNRIQRLLEQRLKDQNATANR